MKRKERKQKDRKECMIATIRDVRVAIGSERRIILLMYKETYFLSREVTLYILKVVLFVLQDYRDVLLEELRSRLPPI